MYHRGSHHRQHTPTAQDIELRNQAKLGDRLCNQIDVWRSKQGLKPFTNADLKGNVVHKRGSDDDRRQMIADLISDDASPFTPEDEEALRFMSDASLRQMRADHLRYPRTWTASPPREPSSTPLQTRCANTSPSRGSPSSSSTRGDLPPSTTSGWSR